MTFSIRPYLTSGNLQDKETLNQILVEKNLFLHPLAHQEHVAGLAHHLELQFGHHQLFLDAGAVL